MIICFFFPFIISFLRMIPLERVSAKRYENDLSDYEKAVSGGEPAREPVYRDLRASDLHSLSELEEQRRKRREEYV